VEKFEQVGGDGVVQGNQFDGSGGYLTGREKKSGTINPRSSNKEGSKKRESSHKKRNGERARLGGVTRGLLKKEEKGHSARERGLLPTLTCLTLEKRPALGFWGVWLVQVGNRGGGSSGRGGGYQILGRACTEMGEKLRRLCGGSRPWERAEPTSEYSFVEYPKFGK